MKTIFVWSYILTLRLDECTQHYNLCKNLRKLNYIFKLSSYHGVESDQNMLFPGVKMLRTFIFLVKGENHLVTGLQIIFQTRLNIVSLYSNELKI